MRLPTLMTVRLALATGLLCATLPAWAQNNVPPSRYQVNPQSQSNYGPPPQQQPSAYAPPSNTQPRNPYAQQVPPQTAPYNQQPATPGVRVAQNPNAQTGVNQGPSAFQPADYQPPQSGQLPQYQPGQNVPLQLPKLSPGGPPQQLGPGGNPPHGPVQVQQQVPQRARFQLSPEETQRLHKFLGDWETEGDQIKNFACKFERWEYDPVFGPGPNTPKVKGYGDLKYVKPDKGHFKIEKLEHFTPAAVPGKPASFQEKPGDFGEHWVCDGKAVFEYKFDVKKLMVYEIPKEMQGKAISDGPLPFLFGAKKDELLARYDMKIINETDEEVWLDAWPLRRSDAANFEHVEVILRKPTLQPKAMQVYDPNQKSRLVYIFATPSVNNPLSSLVDWFVQPRTPPGWEKVIERAPDEEPAAPQPHRQANQGRAFPK